jgi:hypothetical protein
MKKRRDSAYVFSFSNVGEGAQRADEVCIQMQYLTLALSYVGEGTIQSFLVN